MGSYRGRVRFFNKLQCAKNILILRTKTESVMVGLDAMLYIYMYGWWYYICSNLDTSKLEFFADIQISFRDSLVWS